MCLAVGLIGVIGQDGCSVADHVRDAKTPLVVPDAAHAIQAAFDVRFPGYGLTSFGQKDIGDGKSLLGFSIEVPNAEQERLLVYICESGGCYRADDTLVSDKVPITEVVLIGSELVYRSHAQRELLRRPVRHPL